MNEAPMSPEQRVVKVVRQNEVKASESGARAAQLKTSVHAVGKDVEAIKAVQSRLRSQISEVSQLQEVRGKLEKLSAGLSGKTKLEKKQVGDLQTKLKGKEAEVERLRQKEDADKTNMTNEEKTSRHASTVAEANKRNVTKHEEGKGEKTKPWEERVVPIKATSSLKDALKGQGILAETIKFYSEHNYSAEPKYTLPIEQVRDLRQRLVEYQRKKSNTPLNLVEKDLQKFAWEEETKLKNEILRAKPDQRSYYERQLEEKTRANENNQKKREQLLVQVAKEADTQIISTMPFYEVAVKQAEKKGQPINIKQFTDGVLQGLDIFADNQTISTHIFEKQGRRNVNNMTAGYYGAGASRFDERFNRYGESNATAEDKIAYEIGYCAGAVVDKSSMHLAQHLTKWIAETVPITDEKSGKMTALGYGYFVNRNMFEIQKTGTRDPREVEAINEALKISSAINKALKDHRFFNESSRYLAGLSEGYDTFTEAKLIKD